MDGSALHAHVSALNTCNQRGGRMLSLVDLIDAGTVDLSLAAYLAAVMRSGASLLVGARPGGAGKTTVMCALLNFLPDQIAIQAVDSPTVLARGQQDTRPGHTCYLAHELNNGPYYAYIWDDDARTFLSLVVQGHIIASNLHADTPEETQDHLCHGYGVDPAHLNAVTLKLYLDVKRTSSWNVQRRVSQVYESNGTEDRLLWTSGRDDTFTRQFAASAVILPEQEREYAEFLTMLLGQDIRRIEDVRRMLIQQPPSNSITIST